jgi:hypothetical protein
MSARGQFDVVGHNLIRYEEFVPGSLLAANNIIIAPENPEDEWARVLMHKIGDWRAVLRSTYIRWALSINGVHLAAAKYKSSGANKEFTVSSIRTNGLGLPRPDVIAKFSFQLASEAHLKIQPMLCAHGFIDLYAGLEEMVFDFYRRYWLERPDMLVRGPDFAYLRKLRRASSASDESKAAWDEAFAARLDQWQRKKLYDGLDKVFLAFCQNAGLQTPSGYTNTSIEMWADSIAGIALIRNLLIHGENKVPQQLADFCEKPNSLGFDFEAGTPLRLTITDLQFFELFCDQLLTGLNLSLAERARPTLKTESMKHFRSEKASKD